MTPPAASPRQAAARDGGQDDAALRQFAQWAMAGDLSTNPEHLLAYRAGYAAGAADEREACAAVCASWSLEVATMRPKELSHLHDIGLVAATADICAERIRARTEI